MVLSVSAGAMALTPETTAVQTVAAEQSKDPKDYYMSPIDQQQAHRLNPYHNIDLFKVNVSYRYWKVAVLNRSSNQLMLDFVKGTPDKLSGGEEIQTGMIVPPYSFKEFYCKQPLKQDANRSDGGFYPTRTYAEQDAYYITAWNREGTKNLDGTIWFKSGTTQRYLNMSEEQIRTELGVK